MEGAKVVVADVNVEDGNETQEHMAGYRDREAILWSLISWEMWRKQRLSLRYCTGHET